VLSWRSDPESNIGPGRWHQRGQAACRVDALTIAGADIVDQHAADIGASQTRQLKLEHLGLAWRQVLEIQSDDPIDGATLAKQSHFDSGTIELAAKIVGGKERDPAPRICVLKSVELKGESRWPWGFLGEGGGAEPKAEEEGEWHMGHQATLV
jgi:hypothetical protein